MSLYVLLFVELHLNSLWHLCWH